LWRTMTSRPAADLRRMVRTCPRHGRRGRCGCP
jgi:hypothetical protein